MDWLRTIIIFVVFVVWVSQRRGRELQEEKWVWSSICTGGWWLRLQEAPHPHYRSWCGNL